MTFFCCKLKTAYAMRISDWSSDACSSDLGGILKPEMVATMADRPIILALANPYPEILPREAKAVRPDCLIATGRSDYPNQVNNVLCFPYIFRCALDVGDNENHTALKLACVRALARLAQMTYSALGQ